MTQELETYHDMTDVFEKEYHEADLAEEMIGAYNGELIGVAYYKPSLVNGIKEFGIVVRKDYQGMGIGNKLLTEIESRATDTLVAKTLISNTAINKLLINHGWKITKRFYRDGFQYLKKWKI